MNILLVGEKSAGIQTLKALTESGHRIVAVMASPSKNGDGLASLWETAEKLGYRIWPSILIIALVLRLMETASADPAAIPLTPQDLTEREYFGHEIPYEGRLSWSLPAREIVNFVRACDFFPFPSPWGHPQTILETMSGAREIAVAKARLTGERCDRAPGTAGKLVGPGVRIACGAEWIIVNKLRVEGRYVNPADALKPEICLSYAR